jgi:hypothetical protein
MTEALMRPSELREVIEQRPPSEAIVAALLRNVREVVFRSAVLEDRVCAASDWLTLQTLRAFGIPAETRAVRTVLVPKDYPARGPALIPDATPGDGEDVWRNPGRPVTVAGDLLLDVTLDMEAAFRPDLAEVLRPTAFRLPPRFLDGSRVATYEAAGGAWFLYRATSGGPGRGWDPPEPQLSTPRTIRMGRMRAETIQAVAEDIRTGPHALVLPLEESIPSGVLGPLLSKWDMPRRDQSENTGRSDQA